MVDRARRTIIHPAFLPSLPPPLVTWAFDAVKETMEETYDASGYGWDDEDKLAQLTEPEARYVFSFFPPVLPPFEQEKGT